jgi:hypothetical protein
MPGSFSPQPAPSTPFRAGSERSRMGRTRRAPSKSKPQIELPIINQQSSGSIWGQPLFYALAGRAAAFVLVWGREEG